MIQEQILKKLKRLKISGSDMAFEETMERECWLNDNTRL